MVSETPWIISSRQVSGTTVLKGHSIGRHGVCSEISLMLKAYQASLPADHEQHESDGKKNTT